MKFILALIRKVVNSPRMLLTSMYLLSYCKTMDDVNLFAVWEISTIASFLLLMANPSNYSITLIIMAKSKMRNTFTRLFQMFRIQRLQILRYKKTVLAHQTPRQNKFLRLRIPAAGSRPGPNGWKSGCRCRLPRRPARGSNAGSRLFFRQTECHSFRVTNVRIQSETEFTDVTRSFVTVKNLLKPLLIAA